MTLFKSLIIIFVLAFFITEPSARAMSITQCHSLLSEMLAKTIVTQLSQLTIVDAQKPVIKPLKSKTPLRERDPIIKKMYQLKLVPDFKILADARKKDLTSSQKKEIILHSQNEAAALATEKLEQLLKQGIPWKQAVQQATKYNNEIYTLNLFNKLFDTDYNSELVDGQTQLAQTQLKLKLPSHPSDFDLMAAKLFDDSEAIWAQRLKRFNQTESGIITPFDFIIAGARFSEWYNWDSFFAVLGLLATNKIEIAKMITENFLDSIDKFGFVPNGGRDYYLDRSQPPFTSAMVVKIYSQIKSQDAVRAKRWLSERAYPLLIKEYKYWMSDSYDATYGLNRYWSSQNKPRPERFGSDHEENFNETYQDTRAQAASGKDFTVTHMRRSTDILSVQLNALLWQNEINLANLAAEIGKSDAIQFFKDQASSRKESFDRYLWDPHARVWRDFDRKTAKRLDQFVTPDIFVPLFVGMASQDQAKGIAMFLKKNYTQGGLLGRGGLIASNVTSGLQWDAPHTWPPHNIMAMFGLNRYGYKKQSRRLAQNILVSVGKIKSQTGVIWEKRDGVTGLLPVEDGSKYPNQENLIWSHAEVIQALQILGYKFE